MLTHNELVTRGVEIKTRCVNISNSFSKQQRYIRIRKKWTVVEIQHTWGFYFPVNVCDLQILTTVVAGFRR